MKGTTAWNAGIDTAIQAAIPCASFVSEIQCSCMQSNMLYGNGSKCYAMPSAIGHTRCEWHFENAIFQPLRLPHTLSTYVLDLG